MNLSICPLRNNYSNNKLAFKGDENDKAPNNRPQYNRSKNDKARETQISAALGLAALFAFALGLSQVSERNRNISNQKVDSTAISEDTLSDTLMVNDIDDALIPDTVILKSNGTIKPYL